MNQINKIIVIISIFIGYSAFLIFKTIKIQENKYIAKEQAQQIQIQSEVINDIKVVKKRQNANVATDIDDDLKWLRANRCTDC